MMDSLITFRSVTPAQKGERVLRREGLECALSRTPKWAQDKGCGYSLRIRQKDALRCAEILRREQIPFKRVYLFRDGGGAEELQV